MKLWFEISFGILIVLTSSCQPHTLNSVNSATTVQIDSSPPTTEPVSLSAGMHGEQLEQAQRYEEALTWTRRAIFKAQEYQELTLLLSWQWQLGRILTAQGQRGAAIEAYREVVKWLVPCSKRENPKSFQWDLTNVKYEQLRPIFLELADLLLQQAAVAPSTTAAQKYLSETREVIEQLKVAALEVYFKDECITAFQQQSSPTVDKVGAGAGVVVIYPIILPQRLELLLNFPDDSPGHWRLERVTVAVTAANFTQVSEKFRNELEKGYSTSATGEYLKEAEQLYKWLIRPIETLLKQHQIKTLVWVPEGVLHNVALAALWDGTQFLVEKYALAITPSLNSTVSTTPSLESRILLAGLSEERHDYPELVYVKAEIDQIQQLINSMAAPPETEILLNDQFKVKQLNQSLKSNNNHTEFRIVHLATHAQFDSTASSRFALVTYDQEVVPLPEKNKSGDQDSPLTFLFQPWQRQLPIELLTLSACETARDDKGWNGLGWSGIAVLTGAQSALATLWKAHDLTTFYLVKQFYRNYLVAGLPKAEALQQAQRNLIAGRQRRYQHPVYWAHLVLIGKWW